MKSYFIAGFASVSLGFASMSSIAEAKVLRANGIASVKVTSTGVIFIGNDGGEGNESTKISINGDMGKECFRGWMFHLANIRGRLESEASAMKFIVESDPKDPKSNNCSVQVQNRGA